MCCSINNLLKVSLSLSVGLPLHLSNFPLHSPDKLQTKLRGEGGIKALLGMVKCGHPDVLAQVARGIANFAKCESRASTQGTFSWRMTS